MMAFNDANNNSTLEQGGPNLSFDIPEATTVCTQQGRKYPLHCVREGIGGQSYIPGR